MRPGPSGLAQCRTPIAARQLTHRSILKSPVIPIYTAELVQERLRRAAPQHDLRDLQLAAPPAIVELTEAAVMVPLIAHPGGPSVLLTQRTAHLADHAGQISFPGGRVEVSDGSREETALRETEEEIGLAREHVMILGRLPQFEIGIRFRITPVVGWVQPPVDLTLDPFEVAAAFEAPLGHFLDISRYLRREYRFQGRHRQYMAIPFQGRYIWGATAAMLFSLARALEDVG